MLHEGAKAYLLALLEDANLLAIHAWRVTLQPQIIQLAHRKSGNKDWNIPDYADLLCGHDVQVPHVT